MIEAGELYLSDTPLLRGHAGTQPDLFLCWNAIPADAAALDVVVHLHGFSQQGHDMPLAEKVTRSGLDLGGRRRPTLAALPRGNWIRHSWYDFPALLHGGLDRLIEYALEQLRDRGLPARNAPAGNAVPKVDRLIVTAHSGGVMPAIDLLPGLRRPPDELHLFDGLYGRDPSQGDPLGGIEVIDAWLAERLDAESQRAGALRVVYIERQTGPFSRALATLVERRLGALGPDLAARLRPRYRVEPSAVPHAYVASVCGPVLLGDPAAELDWANIV
ncbi:MAG: hypothetical protein ACM3JG_01615 [Thiohalocapsa sp.]